MEWQEILDNDNKDNNSFSISDMTESMLADVRLEQCTQRKTTIPIEDLFTLGSGILAVASELRNMSNMLTAQREPLYRLVNAGVGDSLKIAKDGTSWGALKTIDGGSKLAKFSQVDPGGTAGSIVTGMNPATMMMAAALYSIEKDLDNIKEMEKQILSFLQTEKESEIEADIITLNEIIKKYKNNWDNERYVASNHKLVCDIQRTARKNMISYKKSTTEAVQQEDFIVFQGQVDEKLQSLKKIFKYFRMSLYTFSLASFSEILLSGKFTEDNIAAVLAEIRKNSDEYRELFTKCSSYLENQSGKSVETNLLGGLGVASDVMGNILGGIPFLKENKVDVFFKGAGEDHKKNSENITAEKVKAFAEVQDPGTKMFIDKLEVMNSVFNHTSEIIIDKDSVYFLEIA